MSVGHVVNKVLKPFGIKLSWRETPLSQHNIARPVSTIIDVGVAYGTPELYERFPNARLVLVEPNHQFHGFIRGNLLSHRKGVLYTAAAGSSNCVTTVNLEDTKTSLLSRTALTERSVGKSAGTAEIVVAPLDDILSDELIEPPSILKIDTEGYELEVLRGAGETLAKVDYVMAEVSVMRRFEESYSFTELLRYLERYNFRPTRILTAPVDSNGLIRFVDMLFERPSN